MAPIGGKETEPKFDREVVVETPPEMKVSEKLQKDTGIAPVQEPTIPSKSPVKKVGEEETSVEIPTSMDQLERLSKGNADDSSTWFAKFWKRMVKVLTRAGKKFFFRG